MSDNPLAALAMRERAASEMDIAAHVMSHYGSDVEQRTYQYAAKQIRTLPTTFTDAELLAAAMQLPEVRALVDAADAVDDEYIGTLHGPHMASIDELRAALAPFMKGGDK